MTDTIRTQSELLALFADNTSGNVSAQDARDFILTVTDSLFERLKGEVDADRQVHLASGVIRYYDSIGGWDTLYNQGQDHQPIGISSVVSDTNKIRVNIDVANFGDNLMPCGCAVLPSKTYRGGLECSVSVGIDNVEIYLARAGATDYIKYDGASWISQRSAFTCAWSTNKLVLTKNDASNYFEESLRTAAYPAITPFLTPYQVCLGSTGVDTIDVHFYDAAGSSVTIEDTNMKFVILAPDGYERLNPHAIGSSTGAIWVLVLIQSDR